MANLKSNANNEDIEKHHRIIQMCIKKAFKFLESKVEKEK